MARDDDIPIVRGSRWKVIALSWTNVTCKSLHTHGES